MLQEYLRYFALFFSFYAQIKHLYGLLLLDLVPYRNPLEHPNDPAFILCKTFFDVLDTGIYFVLPFSLMIEMANQLRWHADLTDFKTVFFLAVLNSTEVVYTIMPLIMIFASIWLFLALARSSELVVARASGRSGIDLSFGTCRVSVLLSGLILMFLNPIVAYTTARYLTLSQEIKNEGRSVFSIGTEGLWLRQGDTDGYTVVRASGANGAGSVFYDVTFYVYGSDGEIYKRLGADVARLGNGEWQLYTAKSWPLSKDQNPEENASVLASTTLPTDMTQEQVRDRFETPATVPIWNLCQRHSKTEVCRIFSKTP